VEYFVDTLEIFCRYVGVLLSWMLPFSIILFHTRTNLHSYFKSMDLVSTKYIHSDVNIDLASLDINFECFELLRNN